MRNFNWISTYLFMFEFSFFTYTLPTQAWKKPFIKVFIILIVLFLQFTIDLQLALYNDCCNKLTFKGGYTLSVEVPDLITLWRN